MAVEQDWPLYADQPTLSDTDTILARTAVGAGVEVPGSALIKKDSSGNVRVGPQGASPTITPKKLTLAAEYINSATPTNQQLKLEIVYVSATG